MSQAYCQSLYDRIEHIGAQNLYKRASLLSIHPHRLLLHRLLQNYTVSESRARLHYKLMWLYNWLSNIFCLNNVLNLVIPKKYGVKVTGKTCLITQILPTVSDSGFFGGKILTLSNHNSRAFSVYPREHFWLGDCGQLYEDDWKCVNYGCNFATSSQLVIFKAMSGRPNEKCQLRQMFLM